MAKRKGGEKKAKIIIKRLLGSKTGLSGSFKKEFATLKDLENKRWSSRNIFEEMGSTSFMYIFLFFSPLLEPQLGKGLMTHGWKKYCRWVFYCRQMFLLGEKTAQRALCASSEGGIHFQLHIIALTCLKSRDASQDCFCVKTTESEGILYAFM